MSKYGKAPKHYKKRGLQPSVSDTGKDVVMIHGASIYAKRGQERTIWKPIVCIPEGASSVKLQLLGNTGNTGTQQQITRNATIFEGAWPSPEDKNKTYELPGTGCRGPKITCVRPDDLSMPTDPLTLYVFVDGRPSSFSFNGRSACKSMSIVLTHHHRPKRLLDFAERLQASEGEKPLLARYRDELISFARHYADGRFFLDTKPDNNRELLERLQDIACDQQAPAAAGTAAGQQSLPRPLLRAAGSSSTAPEGQTNGGDNSGQWRRRCCAPVHPTSSTTHGRVATTTTTSSLASSSRTATTMSNGEQDNYGFLVPPYERTPSDDAAIARLLGDDNSSNEPLASASSAVTATTAAGTAAPSPAEFEDAGAGDAASLPFHSPAFSRGLDSPLLNPASFVHEVAHDMNEDNPSAKQLCKVIAAGAPGLSPDVLLSITMGHDSGGTEWDAGQQAVFDQLVSSDADDVDNNDDDDDDGEPPKKRALTGDMNTHGSF